MLQFRKLTLGALLVLLTGASAGADDTLMLKQRVTSGLDSPAREQVLYYSPNVRIVDDPRTRSIIDLDAKTFTFINKDKKTYVVMTFDEAAQRRDTHDDRVKELPPQMQQMLHVREKVTATPTGRTATIAGHSAKEYKVESNKVSGSVWLAEDLSLKARSDDWARVAVLLGGTTTPGGQLDETLAKLGGVRLRSQVRIDPLPIGTIEVLEVSHESAPAELRKIPSDYTRSEPRPTRTAAPPTPTAAPKASKAPKKAKKKTPTN